MFHWGMARTVIKPENFIAKRGLRFRERSSDYSTLNEAVD